MNATDTIGILTIAVLAITANAQDISFVDPNKPWTVKGVVVQESGEPLEGAEVIAHTGVGTLFIGGRTTSKADGSFELSFGPGITFKNQEGVQAATISVRKQGWFEADLCRHGDLLAAFKAPKGEIGWGKKTIQDIFLPGEAKSLKFTLKPAAKFSGVLIDADGAPIANKRVGVTGEDLPPSSNAFAEIKTNDAGQFEFENLPTTFRLKVYVETETNRRKWPSVTVRLPEPREFKVRFAKSGDHINFSSEPLLKVLD